MRPQHFREVEFTYLYVMGVGARVAEQAGEHVRVLEALSSSRSHMREHTMGLTERT